MKFTIKHPLTGEVTQLPNFVLRNTPRQQQALAADDVELGKQLFVQFEKEMNPRKKLELYDAVIFQHNFIGAIDHSNRDKAKAIGMTHDEILQAQRSKYAQSLDALTSTTVDFDNLAKALSSENPRIPNPLSAYSSPSEMLAQQYDAHREAKAMRLRALGYEKSRKAAEKKKKQKQQLNNEANKRRTNG